MKPKGLSNSSSRSKLIEQHPAWVPRPIKCGHCCSIIEGTKRQFTFYCDSCMDRFINRLNLARSAAFSGN